MKDHKTTQTNKQPHYCIAFIGLHQSWVKISEIAETSTTLKNKSITSHHSTLYDTLRYHKLSSKPDLNLNLNLNLNRLQSNPIQSNPLKLTPRLCFAPKKPKEINNLDTIHPFIIHPFHSSYPFLSLSLSLSFTISYTTLHSFIANRPLSTSISQSTSTTIQIQCTLRID